MFKQPQQVIELTVDITADPNGSFQFDQRRLRQEDLSRRSTKVSNPIFWDQQVLVDGCMSCSAEEIDDLIEEVCALREECAFGCRGGCGHDHFTVLRLFFADKRVRRGISRVVISAASKKEARARARCAAAAASNRCGWRQSYICYVHLRPSLFPPFIIKEIGFHDHVPPLKGVMSFEQRRPQ